MDRTSALIDAIEEFVSARYEWEREVEKKEDFQSYRFPEPDSTRLDRARERMREVIKDLGLS